MVPTTGAISQFALPIFHLWYLICLVFWRLIGPHWMQFKYPITLAVAVGLMGGYIQKFYVLNLADMALKLPGIEGGQNLNPIAGYMQQMDDVMMQEPFCLHRTMGMFPYYILGMVLKNNGLMGGKEGGWIHKVMSHPWCTYTAWFNWIVMFALSYYAINCQPVGWTCTGSAYFDVDEIMVDRQMIRHGDDLSGDAPNIWSCIVCGFGRLCIYGGCTVQVLLTFCIFPNHEVILNLGEYAINVSDKGKRSLVNYIFHAAVFFLLLSWNWFGPDKQSGGWQWLTVFMCFCVCQFLMSEWGFTIFNKFVAPPMDAWFVPPSK